MTEIETELEEQIDALGKLEILKKERDDMLESRVSNLSSKVTSVRKMYSESKGQLKSDVKKTSAYVKKIKALTSEGIQQCIRDTEILNLTLYITEIVGAVLETNFKATDSTLLVKLCIQLHRRYDDFTQPLIVGLKESLLSASNDEEKDINKKKRIQIRFLIELYESGLFEDDDFFCQLLRSILGKNIKSTQSNCMDLSSFVTFVKYGSETLLGIIPATSRTLALKAGKSTAEIPIKVYSGQTARSEMKMMVLEAFQQISSDLIKAHTDLKAKERKFEKDKQIHGVLSDSKQAELDAEKKSYERLFSSLNSLSNSLDEPMPNLPEIEEDDENTRGISVWDASSSMPTGSDFGAFGDAETRAFYEDLPDILSEVPLSCINLTVEQASILREQWKAAKESLSSVGAESDPNESDDLSAEEKKEPSEETNIEAVEVTENENEDKNEISSVSDSSRVKLSTLLEEKLPECTNKQKSDEFCISFCYNNTKNARKQLTVALGMIRRNRFELIPTYARITASLARVLPDIAQPILDNVWRQFYGMYKAKNQLYIDSKIRNIRYIGELVKFNVAPPIIALKACKLLLNDFAHHNVELLAALLESCGRYLYLLPATRDRIEAVLETMMRLRRSKNIDVSQQSLLVSAYFTVKPPDRVAKSVRSWTPLQQYIRHLIIERLPSETADVDAIIKLVRKLPWSDAQADVQGNLIYNCVKLCAVKYTGIPLVSDLLSGLLRHRPKLIIAVVDTVLEELQRGFDIPNKREPQRMLGLTRLLAELYNFSALSAQNIFDILYHFINFGHEVSESKPPSSSQPISHTLSMYRNYDPSQLSDLDPPDDIFRIQFVCELLSSCGAYFITGANRVKLDIFLVFFQRYILSKASLPPHCEYSVTDLFESLEALGKEAEQRQRKKLKQEGKAEKDDGNNEGGKKACFPVYDAIEPIQITIQSYIDKAPGQGTGSTKQEEEDDDDDDDEDDEAGDRSRPSRQGEDQADESVVDPQTDPVDDDGDVTDLEAAKLLEQLREREKEDEEFEKAFKQAMQESVETVRASVGTVKSSEFARMAIPAVIPKPKSAPRPVDTKHHHNLVQGPTFKLLSRDTKGRIESREIMIPEQNPLAIKLKEVEEKVKQEKRLLKEQVLKLAALASEEEGGEGDNYKMEALGNRERDMEQDDDGGSTEVRGGGRRGGRGLYVPRNIDYSGESKKNSTELNLNEFLSVSDDMERRRYISRGGNSNSSRGRGGGGSQSHQQRR